MLASEALKDELAPVEPLRAQARAWCVAAGAVFAALGFAPRWTPAGKPVVELCAGAAAVAVGLAPMSYRLRAALMVSVAAAVGLLGVLGVGPASAMAYSVGEWGLLHMIAVAALPAALLFRSRYRAYAGARAILAAALALALPLLSYCALAIDGAPLAVQITSALAIVAVGFSLVGFMGSETTVAGDYLAGAIIAAVVAQVGAVTVGKLQPANPQVWISMLASAASFGGAAAVSAIGLFQLLAGRHWERARQVDVHPNMSEPPSAPPSQPSLSDTWSSRS